MCLLGLCRGGHLARPDSPYWFIRNDDLAESMENLSDRLHDRRRLEVGIDVPPISLFQHLHDSLELLFADLGSFACLALPQRLADAEDNSERGVECRAGLLSDDLRGLMEERPSLRVALKSVGG